MNDISKENLDGIVVVNPRKKKKREKEKKTARDKSVSKAADEGEIFLR